MANIQMDVTPVLPHLAARHPGGRPHVVGITGAVAAGKSVFAQALDDHFSAGGAQVERVCSDGFLFSNARLAELGLSNQKGFPTSYDHAALRAALTAIREGPTVFPGYSHVTYDVDPALARTLNPPDILLIEGLNLIPTHGPSLIDTLIYLDAEEGDLEAWFTARFMGLWDAAEHDPTSFYARFRKMGRSEATAFAKMVWEQINLRNLREHIMAAREIADIVVRKGPGHEIASVEVRA